MTRTLNTPFRKRFYDNTSEFVNLRTQAQMRHIIVNPRNRDPRAREPARKPPLKLPTLSTPSDRRRNSRADRPIHKTTLRAASTVKSIAQRAVCRTCKLTSWHTAPEKAGVSMALASMWVAKAKTRSPSLQRAGSCWLADWCYSERGPRMETTAPGETLRR